MAPRIFVGTGAWSYGFDVDKVREQLNNLDKLGCRQIDTAALYPFTIPNLAEKLFSEIGHDGLLINTKVMWFDGCNNTPTLDAVQKSAEESLARLKTEKVGTTTPLPATRPPN